MLTESLIYKKFKTQDVDLFIEWCSLISKHTF